jgi:hypothetical protein
MRDYLRNFLYRFPTIIFESNTGVYFMLRVNNIVKVLALSTVMFGAGVTVATVALSYLPTVNATPTTVAQGLKQSKPEQIDEETNLKFELQDCKRSNQTIICNVLVTNQKNESQEFRFHTRGYVNGSDKSRIIDTSGNEYIAKLVKIGQKEDSEAVSTQLIRGVPLKISLSFQTPREVTKLAVVEVNYQYPYTNNYRQVQFRDINISGSQASNPANPGSDCTCPPQTTPKKPRPR